jgi:hypothetical protein
MVLERCAVAARYKLSTIGNAFTLILSQTKLTPAVSSGSPAGAVFEAPLGDDGLSFHARFSTAW